MNAWHRRAICAAAVLAAASCRAPPPNDDARFAHWRQTALAAEVPAYISFLRSNGVDSVLPLRDLLRSGRAWQRCGVPEFVVPPRSRWQTLVPTLELVAELRERLVLPQARAASVYRTVAFNTCERGSARSRHLDNAAIDFDLVPNAEVTARLCGYWRQHGARHRFGLGFYDLERIHVDTRGYRTWGRDHTRRTSLCVTPATR